MENQPINPAASGLAAVTAINQLIYALVENGIIEKAVIIAALNEGAEALEQAGAGTSTALNRDAADQLRMIAASYQTDL